MSHHALGVRKTFGPEPPTSQLTRSDSGAHQGLPAAPRRKPVRYF